MKQTVMVVDDSQPIRYLYNKYLQDDYNIIEAEDGQAGIDMYKECRPDLVIMDICMPIKGGDEAIKEILDYDPAASIIAITAYEYSKGDLGVPVVSKGFSQKVLVDLVNKYLSCGITIQNSKFPGKSSDLN